MYFVFSFLFLCLFLQSLASVIVRGESMCEGVYGSSSMWLEKVLDRFVDRIETGEKDWMPLMLVHCSLCIDSVTPHLSYLAVEDMTH